MSENAQSAAGPPFEALDFLYMPSRDVERDLAYFTEVIGGVLIFAIEAYGARVAQFRLSDAPPRLLLADHLEGQTPFLVYRVGDLDSTLAQLERRDLELEGRFGIPHGPCAAVRAPGGQRLALYELTRPQADDHLAGRLDFGPAGRALPLAPHPSNGQESSFRSTTGSTKPSESQVIGPN